MRRLEPAGLADLAEAYAYPDTTPWLRGNMVASADGAATFEGKAGGLGNEADRRLLSLLRGLADVVIAGAATVRVEGYGPVHPREWWGDIRKGRPAAPPLAIVSRSLELDFDAPVFTEATARTIVITCASAPEDRRSGLEKHADVIVAGEEEVDVAAALDALAERGLTRQLTEGGPRLLARFVAAERLDELCLTVSPQITAGDAARIVNGPGPASTPYRLGHVLEDEDFLFLRYTRRDDRGSS
ncbi:pyrimidine reductase family protein [Actinoallomurus soli]|uniref:pyrimidine reductase family protein n=1 Tax=Actinoallomurus soli TaxID=2952535 RepID=UPI0020935A90|nr:pyrimidine reductase family protein [Actinoallomurus soli]MCO5970529.1 pyrimidine reductase family protein [Actinoallomurus soli]